MTSATVALAALGGAGSDELAPRPFAGPAAQALPAAKPQPAKSAIAPSVPAARRRKRAYPVTPLSRRARTAPRTRVEAARVLAREVFAAHERVVNDLAVSRRIGAQHEPEGVVVARGERAHGEAEATRAEVAAATRDDGGLGGQHVAHLHSPRRAPSGVAHDQAIREPAARSR